MVALFERLIFCQLTENVKGFYRIVTVVLISGIVSACQTVPDVFGFKARQLESIETNRFHLKPNEDVIGQLATVEVRQGESLPDIARHFGLGYREITNANSKLNVWAPGGGSQVLLPLRFILPDAPRKGIVVNLADMRLFYYPENSQHSHSATVMTYSTGIGREGWSTPLGKSRIIGKRKSPKWYVPASIRREHALKGDPLPAVVPPGPDNPLGEYAMRLSMPNYLIHGTNKPYGVGLRVSHGCVRLYPEDIEALFKHVSVGTDVRIVNQPYLAGWQDGMLYLAAHKPKSEQDKSTHRLKQLLVDKLKQYSSAAGVDIDWNKVADALANETGIPTPVLAERYIPTRLFYDIPLVARPVTLPRIPVIPPLKTGDWSVVVENFVQESSAVQLAAILNHQGPQIPTRVVKRNSSYHVVAGPFKNRNQARRTSWRMQRELELDTQVRQVD